jgi:hypothetical protein
MSSMTTRLTVAGAGAAVRPRQKRAALTVAMLDASHPRAAE